MEGNEIKKGNWDMWMTNMEVFQNGRSQDLERKNIDVFRFILIYWTVWYFSPGFQRWKQIMWVRYSHQNGNV